MKTIKARNNSGDDWKTPSDFYQKLDAIYHFDFDPCPYQADFDGLKVEWGGVNFIIRHIALSGRAVAGALLILSYNGSLMFCRFYCRQKKEGLSISGSPFILSIGKSATG